MVSSQYKAQIKTYSANINRYNRMAMQYIGREDYELAKGAYLSISENINHIENCIRKIGRANKPVDSDEETKSEGTTLTETSGSGVTTVKEALQNGPSATQVIAGQPEDSDKEPESAPGNDLTEAQEQDTPPNPQGPESNPKASETPEPEAPKKESENKGESGKTEIPTSL